MNYFSKFVLNIVLAQLGPIRRLVKQATQKNLICQRLAPTQLARGSVSLGQAWEARLGKVFGVILTSHIKGFKVVQVAVLLYV